MSQEFIITTAKRSSTIPLIGLYGESGCGKTYSALMVARGIVGPEGRIAMIDTESKRGSIYADIIPGGYEHMDFASPFSSERYIKAIDAVESKGFAIGIIDSASHEWEGEGGVTAAAGDISERRAKKRGNEWDGTIQFGDWKEPKMDHQRFMLRMLRSRIPWIVCLRAKYKSRQVKGTREMADAGAIRNDQVGKQVVIKDEFTSPIQAEDFIYEMTAQIEVLPDHSISLVKCSHPSLRDCFPTGRSPLSVSTGEAIRAWCEDGGPKARPQKPAAPPRSRDSVEESIHRQQNPEEYQQQPEDRQEAQGELVSTEDAQLVATCKRLRKAIWTACNNKFQKGGQMVEWLEREGHMRDTEIFEELGQTRLNQIIDSVLQSPPK